MKRIEPALESIDPEIRSALESIRQMSSRLDTLAMLSLPASVDASLSHENDSLKNQIDMLEEELKTYKTKERYHIQEIKRLKTQLNRYKKSIPAHLDSTPAWVEDAPSHK